MLLRLPVSRREPLRQFPSPAFRGALLAPSLDTRALVKGTLTERPLHLSIRHAHAHLALR
jgi:hypothetical protein